MCLIFNLFISLLLYLCNKLENLFVRVLRQGGQDEVYLVHRQLDFYYIVSHDTVLSRLNTSFLFPKTNSSLLAFPITT